jgi:hypothetical protein
MNQSNPIRRLTITQIIGADKLVAVTANINIVTDTFYFLFLIVATYLIIKTRVPQQTIENQRQLIDTYEKRINALEDELKANHRIQLDNIAAISELQGQVKIYKELPWKELTDGIKEVAESNQMILNELQKTATIAAEDRDVLTNQNLHIRSEVKKQLGDV